MGLYFKQTFGDKFKKSIIVIHDTVGSANGENVKAGWIAKSNNISTCKVISGKPNTDKELAEGDFDGVVIDVFDPKYWSYHLGISDPAYRIQKSSCAIELCSFGPLLKTTKGFMNVYHSIVPDDQVIKLGKTFRGYDYFEKYSDKQLISLKEQLILLANTFSIDLHSGLYKLIKNGNKAFELQSGALQASPGLYTHVNYRKADKWDCQPQPNLIQMIMEL
jgi:hypothetical protein